MPSRGASVSKEWFSAVTQAAIEVAGEPRYRVLSEPLKPDLLMALRQRAQTLGLDAWILRTPVADDRSPVLPEKSTDGASDRTLEAPGPAELSAYTILVPTRRAARELAAAFGPQGKTDWFHGEVLVVA